MAPGPRWIPGPKGPWTPMALGSQMALDPNGPLPQMVPNGPWAQMVPGPSFIRRSSMRFPRLCIRFLGLHQIPEVKPQQSTQSKSRSVINLARGPTGTHRALGPKWPRAQMAPGPKWSLGPRWSLGPAFIRCSSIKLPRLCIRFLGLHRIAKAKP